MKARRVFPVEGVYINGVPHVEHECDDEFCVESGAFTEKPPPRAAKSSQPEGPPDGGSSDSAEE